MEAGRKDDEPSPPETRQVSRRKKPSRFCEECGDKFPHGIALRKHQRQTGHSGSYIKIPLGYPGPYDLPGLSMEQKIDYLRSQGARYEDGSEL